MCVGALVRRRVKRVSARVRKARNLGDSLKSKHSNKIYQIKKNFNCNSKMVVYLIERRVCGKKYNGSTVTKFRKEQKLSN